MTQGIFNVPASGTIEWKGSTTQEDSWIANRITSGSSPAALSWSGKQGSYLAVNDTAPETGSVFSTLSDISGVPVLSIAHPNAIGGDSDYSIPNYRAYFTDTNLGINTNTPAANLDIYNASGATDSAFKVSHNNATVMNITGSNVGIGTDSPAFALDVNGDIRIEDSHYLRFGGDGASDSEWIMQQASNNLNFGEVGVADNVLLLEAGGKVGMGTSNPDGGHLHIYTAADQALKIESSDGNVDAVFKDTGGTGILRFLTNTFRFYTDSAYSVTPLTLQGANVGINTTGPNATLDVKGTTVLGSSVTVSGATTFENAVNVTSSTGISLTRDDSNSAIYGPHLYIQRKRATGDLSSGDVIGYLDFRPYRDDYDNIAASIYGAVEGTMGSDTTPGNLRFATAAAGANTTTERMRIDSAGNVGIGTSGPNKTLDVKGDAIIEGDLTISGTSKVIFGGTGEYIYADGNDVRIHASDHLVLDAEDQVTVRASDFAWETDAAAEKMRFDADNGRLGIMTNSPNQALDVKGNSVLGESASSTHTISGSMNFIDRATTTPGANHLWASGTALYWNAQDLTAGGGGGSTSPGGSDTQVQFNDGGAFGGDAGLTYSKSADALFVSKAVGIGTTHIDNTRQSEGLTISGTRIQDAGIDASNVFATSLNVPLMGSGAYFLASIGGMSAQAGDNRGTGFEPAYLTVGPTQGVNPSGNFMAGGRAVSLVLAGTSGYVNEENPWGFGNFGSLLFHGTTGWTSGARRWLVSNAWRNSGAGDMGLGFASAEGNGGIDPTISGSTPSVIMSCDYNYGGDDGVGGLLVGNTSHIAGGKLTVKSTPPTSSGSGNWPQMTLAYDGSNYSTFNVTSDGILSISGATAVTVPPFQVLPGGGVHIDRYTRLMRNTSTNGLYVSDSGGNPVKVGTASGTNGGFSPNNTTTDAIYRDVDRIRYDSRDAHHFVGDMLVSGTTNLKDNLEMENDQYIKFYQNGGSTYHTSIGYNTSNELQLGGLYGIKLRTYSGGWGNRVTVLSDGKVGIGTDGPNGILDVRGTTLLQDVTASGTIDMTSNNGIAFDNTNNNNQWFISNRGTNAATLGFGIGNIDNSNLKIAMSGDGYLGIGDFEPNAHLDVRGTSILGGNTIVSGSATVNNLSAGHAIIADTDYSNGDQIRVLKDGNTSLLGKVTFDGTNMVVGAWGSGGGIRFWNHSEGMRLTGGKLGIGTTGPNATLDVKGNTVLGESASSTVIVSGAMGIKTSSIASGYALDVRDSVSMRFEQSASQRLLFYGQNDHATINVTGSSHKLALQTGGPGISFQDGSANEHLLIQETGTNNAHFRSAGNMYFAASGGTSAFIEGNVGIGQDGPNTTLDVKGTTTLGGNTTVSGTATVTGLNIGGTAITATGAELNYVDGVTSAIQTQLDAKEATISASNRVNATEVGTGVVDNTEFNYLNGVTSAIQTQLDAKAPTASPTFTGTVDAGGNVAVAGNVTVDDNMTVSGSTTVEGQLLSVQKQMKNDISANYTVSTDYSHYLCHADAQTITITMPTSPSVGDEYWIVARTTGMTDPHAGGIPGQVQIQAGSGGNINLVDNGSYIAIGVSNATVVAKMKMAHIICIESDTWAMTVSDECPTS